MTTSNSLLKWLVLASMVVLLYGAESSSKIEYLDDPYLEYRPDFARSLPVQILLTGIVLTLTAVLFIHLMFTAQYHWPLAPVNYVLQLSGVTTLLISLIATIHVVLSATIAQSEKWPYMLDYIAFNVPPPIDIDTDADSGVWSMAERATWLVMNASTSGLIQITHIQFLTLLYPSRLEGQLIFALLGPLAGVAAVMQLVPINTNVQVNIIAAAVRNVCNATLSLLFTVALFIWGLLVNRKQAWRTDGGTAAFGAAALLLAIISTALNFLYVHREDEFVWLPGLMWAVILWQSFLGWWWWVGAGSGAGLASAEELEDKLARRAQRETRAKDTRDKKRQTTSKAWKVWNGMTEALTPGDRAQSSGAQIQASESGASQTRPRTSGRRRARVDDGDRSGPPSPIPSLIPSTLSATSVVSYNTLPRGLPRIIHQWYSSLRREHVEATRRQAAERVERIRELERNGIQRAPTGSGWGLGSFGWIIASTHDDRGASRGRSKDNHSRSPSVSRSRGFDRDRTPGDVELAEIGESRSRSRSRSRGGRRTSGDTLTTREQGSTSTEEARSDLTGDGAREEISNTQSTSSGRPRSRRGSLRITIPDPPTRTRSPNRGASSPQSPEPTVGRPKSIWWWGPLWRWRLKDSTAYS